MLSLGLSCSFVSIMKVKLTDQLVNSLDFIKAKDCELAWIDGQVDINTEALSSEYIRVCLSISECLPQAVKVTQYFPSRFQDATA